jgi:DNA-binding XRE family transcriptional regulator
VYSNNCTSCIVVVTLLDIERRAARVKTIRALRHERRWTQFELALNVGVQPQAVYLWESGRRTPQVLQLRKLGELFGICSDEIELVALRSGDNEHDRPSAGRRLDERAPGRDRLGRPNSRGEEPPFDNAHDA